jgi:OmpA-OmpF porin, OOP family
MSTKRRLYLLLAAFSVVVFFRQGAAFAQAQSGEFSVQRFDPAPGTHNYLSVEGVRMEGGWGWTAGFLFNYAREPFTVQSCANETDCSAPNANTTDVKVVRDLFTWDLMGSVSPIPRLQIGLRLPLVYASGQGFDATSGQPTPDGIKSFAVGDLTLEGKVRLFGGASDPYLFGAAVDVSFPTGHASADGAYVGNSSPVTVGVRGIFDGSAGPLTFAANLRGVFRDDASLGTTQVGPVDFRYGAGLGFRVSPVFKILAEGYGSTQFKAQNGTNNLEIDGAVEIQPLDSSFIIRVGGGAGVIQGVGVPMARAIAGITYTRELRDTDGDGIPDRDDRCVTIPEDKDGFEDNDGCPDPDNDRDGVADEKDKCPNQPETLNGFQDKDGCPDDIADRDKDGIPDNEDKCPDEGGRVIVRNPKSPYYGCPDSDSDGIPDKIDKCPDQPEDTDGFDDLDGCPDPDNDKDGIPDEADECINQPEDHNGFQDKDGCPDTAPGGAKSLVEVGPAQIKILETVEFETGKAAIKGARSFMVLDAVAAAMKGHAHIALVEVAGHTDNVGPAPGNRDLSQKRAEAVAAYLKTKGVAEARLTPKGYGPDKPIADNKTAAGKQKNRRVEFNIVSKP